MIDRRGLLFGSVLKLTSVREIEKLGPHALELARRWIEEWPAKVRELEAAGNLIPTLKHEAEEDALRQWRARVRIIAGRH